MNQHKIGNPDLMGGEMSGNGAEAQVGHLYYPVKVVSRIRHGQEQYVQGFILLNHRCMISDFLLQTPAIILHAHYMGRTKISKRDNLLH